MRVSSKTQPIRRSGHRTTYKRQSNTDPADSGSQPAVVSVLSCYKNSISKGKYLNF